MSELENENKAGFLKLPEQVESIENVAFEKGYQEATNDARAGRMAKQGIYSLEQVNTFVNIYGKAVYQSLMENKQLYGWMHVDIDRKEFCQTLIQEADAKFGNIVSGNTGAQQEV